MPEVCPRVVEPGIAEDVARHVASSVQDAHLASIVTHLRTHPSRGRRAPGTPPQRPVGAGDDGHAAAHAATAAHAPGAHAHPAADASRRHGVVVRREAGALYVRATATAFSVVVALIDDVEREGLVREHLEDHVRSVAADGTRDRLPAHPTPTVRWVLVELPAVDVGLSVEYPRCMARPVEHLAVAHVQVDHGSASMRVAHVESGTG